MGKSTSGLLLKKRGVHVVDTDIVARDLVEQGMPALGEIRKEFGEDLLDSQGRLQRGKLASIVFADPDSRRRLENILHPLIRAEWQRRVQTWRDSGQAVSAVIIPLLFETVASEYFDKIICVACGAPTQRARLAERNWSDKEITQRIAAQMPVADKITRADYVVWTDTTVTIHQRQLEVILAHLASR